MSKVNLEFNVNSGEVSFVLIGNQEGVGMKVPCEWICDKGNGASSYEYFSDSTLLRNESIQEMIVRVESYVEEMGFNNYEIKCSVRGR